MNDLIKSQLLVLVERHLALESRLADALHDANEASAKVFAKAGLRGPSQQDLQTIEPMMDAVRKLAAEVVEARQATLSLVNRELQTQFTKIKQFIRTLDGPQRRRLTAARRRVLDQSNRAQANLIHNQAVLFYTFDFHRKYLAGVLQSDPESQNYGANGQTSNVSPGNILGKTC